MTERERAFTIGYVLGWRKAMYRAINHSGDLSLRGEMMGYIRDLAEDTVAWADLVNYAPALHILGLEPEDTSEQ